MFYMTRILSLLLISSVLLSAEDDYARQRENMIRAIEADVDATSIYIKKEALDPRVI